MASGRFAEVRTPLILSILMVLMTQVGYLDLMNTWSGDEESLDETTDVLETGGSGSSSVYANNKVSAGYKHTCAILDNGEAKCWGRDNYGQLGDGGSTNTDTNAPSSTVINLGSGRTAVAVSAGAHHACAILDNGDLKCWGSDDYGQLGDGGTNTNTSGPSSTAINLGTGRTAVAVSAGMSHTCAILDNGDLKCWGSDGFGQLGDGGSTNTNTSGPSSTAINLGTGRTAVAVSAGIGHTCAILDNGDLKCWGRDNYGQLGDGGSNTNTNAPSSTAISLGSGRTAVAVATGTYHTCAILDNGDLKCWGWDSNGQLGDGGSNTNLNAPSSTAINLGSGRTAVAVSAGMSYHTCAILDNGDLKCWGSDSNGQLGDGGTNTNTNAPSSTAIDLGTGRTAVAVSAGIQHTCAILDNGEAKCWGLDDYGQLGDGGSNSNQGSPVAVSGSNTWDNTTTASSGSGGGSGSSNTLTPSVEGADLILDEAMTNITFQYNASAASGSNQSSFVNNIGLRTTSGSATQTTSGSAITPIEFSLEWDNFSLPSSLSSSETATFPFDHSLNDTSSTPLENSTVPASNLTYDRHGREMHALDEEVHYEQNRSKLAINQNRISLSLWIKPTNVGTEQSIIDNHPQYHFRMNADGSLNFRNRQHTNGAWNDHYSSIQLENDVWYHIGVSATYSSSYVVNFYVNGTSDVTRTSSGNSFTSSTSSSFDLMGPSGSIISFEGILDDLYLYDAVLSASDFTTLMDVGEITWDISPALPSGLSLDSFTGTITGTPSGSQGTGQYTVYANSSTTSYSRTFSLSFNSGSGMTNVTGATCSVSPALPAGLSIDSSTCTISGTPTAETSNTTYTVTGNISNVTYQGSVWLSTSTFGTITSAVEGAALNLGEAMTPITLNYTSSTNANAASTVFGNQQISTGRATSCIILQNQSLMCFGQNSNGEAGVGNTSSVTIPTWVDFGFDVAVSTVSNGEDTTCALLTNGSLYCWGDVHGSSMSTTPKYIDLPPGRTAVGVSVAEQNTCVLLDNGSISCIGSGYGGTNGDGSSTNFPASSVDVGDTYVQLPTGRTAVSVSMGYRHGCAVLDNGSAMCWGAGGQGELGDGSLSTSSVPVYVNMPTGSTTQTISTGDGTTCAILGNGSVYCWGMGGRGQLGQGHQDHNRKTTPHFVDLGTGRSALAIDTSPYASGSSHYGHACAVLDNGSVKCWGSNNDYAYAWFGLRTASTLGNGTPIVNNPWASEDAIAVSTGMGNTCIVYASGTMTCQGRGSAGALGNGLSHSYYNSTIPIGNPSVDTTTVSVTWETHPALPAGMSISGGTISGTPSVYATNQTYTIYANQSGYSTTHELYLSVDTDNAHTVVENQAIDPIGFHPPFWNGTTAWTVSPALPGNLSINGSTGEITGTMNGTLANTTYTVTATHNGSATETFSFNLRSLADYDGDGLANDLPSDYDAAEGPTSGLVADTDDDADGLNDSIETGTGTYVDGSDTGTNPLNPDTDGDGICDGPVAFPGVCTVGPDTEVNLIPVVVGVNNTAINTVSPYATYAGGVYEVDPSLPSALVLDANTGEITGTPTQVQTNTTYTMWLNHTDGTSIMWNFSIEILEDTDGDGLPNTLPDDYDSGNPVAPGLVEDEDDDDDGLNDLNETDTGTYLNESDTGTSPLNPDTDGDGMCDGPLAVPGVCEAGPDAFPLDPSADTDTDGDGMPDTIDGNSTSQPPLVEDMDDDGDGLEDVNETDTGIYNGSTDTGTDPLDPDTDNDGICDGPNAVPPICVAGPDISPLGEAAVGDIYALNNTLMASLSPADRVPGGTFEIVPDLPAGLTMDPLTGIISGTPTETMESTNFTVYSNSSTMSTSYSFNLTVLGDFDMDGMPDELPDDYPDTGVEPYTLIEDEDDDNDGLLDTNESIIGTDPYNPDTDGDGFCDGNLSVANVCSAGPDPYPLDPNAPVDTDGDGLPDELPPGYEGELLEDEDDDNDGFSDLSELACNSDSKNASSIPNDMDGDAICDSEDPDRDGDGIENEAEIGESLGGTDSNNPDTDGDGVCDGPSVPANGGCLAGPDAFPLDPAGALDTDGDGKPDELLGTSTSEPPLVEDLDDDGDTWPDAMELLCGTYPKVALSVPADTDGDGICDALDDVLDLPFTLEYPTQYVDLFVNQTMEPLLPFVNGSGEVVTWELEGELPEGLTFGWSPARDASMDGSIRGTPTNATETLNLIVWANNSFYSESFSLSLTVFNDSDNDSLPDELPEGYLGNLTADPDDDNDGLSDAEETTCGSNPLDAESGRDQWVTVCLDLNSGDDDDGFGWIWCFPCLLLLLLLLIIPLLLGRDRFLVMLADGPEPENTTAEPNFVAGSGTEDDPFILAPVGPLQPGSMESTVEEITITNMGDIKIDMVDFNDEDNYGRFSMYESDFSMEGSRILAVGKDGEVVINFKFDDREFPTYEGGTYTGRIKLGKASVYFLWEVTVMADEGKAQTEKKKTMDRIKKRKKAFDFERIGKATKKNADDLQAIKGIGPYSEEKLNALGIFTYAQLANFDRKTEDEVNDAIEHYKGRIRRDEWVKQARDIIGAEAKADEEALKAAEEAQAKAEAEAKAAEEAEAAKKAEEAAAAKAAKEEAAAAALAEKEAKDAEKKAKAEADKKAKEEAAAKKKADAEAKKAAAAAAAAATPVTKEAKKKEELKRVKERSKSIDFTILGTANASEKDDLQAIKGIGPFIEEKLNALGIYTFEQVSKMTAKIEEDVNVAIEFFPGRVKRDEWAKQAKKLHKDKK